MCFFKVKALSAITPLFQHPAMLVILWALLSGAALFSWGRFRDLKCAEWIATVGHYQALSQEGIDSAIQETESMGVLDSFLQYLVKVRSHYGHSGVKIGHVIWILG